MSATYHIWTPTEPRRLHKITLDGETACDFAVSGFHVEILEDRDGDGFQYWYPISAHEIYAKLQAAGSTP